MDENSIPFPSTKTELRNLSEEGVSRLLKATGPKHHPEQVITEGVTTHKHDLFIAPWDRQRLGPDVCDIDKDPGTEIAFPMATYKDLYTCACGREIVRAARALI